MADELNKKPWTSKTVLLNVIVSIAGVLGMLGVPVVNDFVTGHPDLIMTVIGVIGIGLRFITKGAIELK